MHIRNLAIEQMQYVHSAQCQSHKCNAFYQFNALPKRTHFLRVTLNRTKVQNPQNRIPIDSIEMKQKKENFTLGSRSEYCNCCIV